MKKVICIIAIAASLFTSCKKDDNKKGEAGLNKLFDKEYALSNATYSSGYANDFVELSDGSVIILASVQDLNKPAVLTLLKLDANGEKIWQKPLLTQTSFDQEAYFFTLKSIERDNNDNVIISASKSDHTFAFKVDKNGNVIWNRDLGDISGEGAYGSGNCVITANQDIVFLFNPQEGSQERCTLVFIKSDNSNYSTTYIKDIVYAGDLKLTSDNYLLVAGLKFNEDRDTKICLVKLNQNGVTIWRKDITNIEGTQHVHSITELDNNFYLTGHTAAPLYRNILFQKYTSTGELVESKNFGQKFDDVGITIQALNSNTLAIGGYSSTSESYDNNDMYLNITDTDGNVLIEENLQQKGWIRSIKKSTGNNFYVLGSINYSPQHIKLLKYSYR